MSKRVLVSVDRGMTDKTSKVVWDHEVPILQAVHGADIKLLDLSEVEDLKGSALVLQGTTQVVDPKDPRFRDQPKERVPLVEILKRNLSIGEQFSGNIDEEYDRLIACYGTHPDYNMPFVEYVYGRPDRGDFKKAIGEIVEAEENYDESHPGAKPVALRTEPLTEDEMRAELDRAHIEYPKSAKGPTLRRLYEAAMSTETA
jgi:hypothetical protein